MLRKLSRGTVHAKGPTTHNYAGFSSQIGTKLRDWADGPAGAGKAVRVRDTGSVDPGSRPLFGSGSGSLSLFLPSEWYLSSSNPIQLKPNQYFRCLRSWPVTTHAMGQTSVREARVIGIFKKISASGVPSLVAVVVPSVTNTSVSTN